jgi:hypothetical protein
MRRNSLTAVVAGILAFGTYSISIPASAETAEAAAMRQKMISLLEATPGFTLPEDHKALDQALAQDNIASIRQLLPLQTATPSEVQKYLAWERYAQLTGGGFGVSFIYAGDLWIMSNSYDKAVEKASDPQQIQSMRQMSAEYRRDALTYALYTIALIEVDGARCSWEPASQGQLNTLLPAWKPIWQFGAQLPQQDKEKAVLNATKLERLIAPLRQSDRWLCMTGWRNRPDAAAASLGPNWTGARPAPDGAGGVGQTYTAKVDPTKLPLFVDEKDWAAREQAKRATLGPKLLQLLKPNS